MKAKTKRYGAYVTETFTCYVERDFPIDVDPEEAFADMCNDGLIDPTIDPIGNFDRKIEVTEITDQNTPAKEND